MNSSLINSWRVNVATSSVSSAKTNYTNLVSAISLRNGTTSSNVMRLTSNGLNSIARRVPSARNRSNVQWGAISCIVHLQEDVPRTFVTSVKDLGNLTTRTTLSATSPWRRMIRKTIKIYCRGWTSTSRNSGLLNKLVKLPLSTWELRHRSCRTLSMNSWELT